MFDCVGNPNVEANFGNTLKFTEYISIFPLIRMRLCTGAFGLRDCSYMRKVFRLWGIVRSNCCFPILHVPCTKRERYAGH